MPEERIILRAKVTKVDSKGVYVEVPSLGTGLEYGPLETNVVGGLASGDRVVVGQVSDVGEDYVVLAKMGNVPVPVTVDAYTTAESDARFPRKFTFGIGEVYGSTRWFRIATINGGSATGGASLSLLVSGTGSYGSAQRATDIVHFGQRGDNAYHWTGWRLGGATGWTYMLKQTGTWTFELWARRPSFDPYATAIVLAGMNYTMNWDSVLSADPGDLITLATPSLVSVAGHVHSGADITTGTVPFARLPTGTTSTTVAIGNHGHTNTTLPAEVVYRINHGSVASTARPPYFYAEWVGSVTPTNMGPNDTWVNTAL